HAEGEGVAEAIGIEGSAQGVAGGFWRRGSWLTNLHVDHAFAGGFLGGSGTHYIYDDETVDLAAQRGGELGVRVANLGPSYVRARSQRSPFEIAIGHWKPRK